MLMLVIYLWQHDRSGLYLILAVYIFVGLLQWQYRAQTVMR